MKIQAVCVRCGAFKKAVAASCPECGYAPESEYELVRALILSKQFFAGNRVIGRPVDELRTIGEQIRSGRPYYFDAQEQQIVAETYREYTASKPSRHRFAFSKWLLLLLILVLAAVVFLLLRLVEVWS